MNQDYANRLTTMIHELDEIFKQAALDSLRKQLKLKPSIDKVLYLRFAYLTYYNQFVNNLSLIALENSTSGMKEEVFEGESLR